MGVVFDEVVGSVEPERAAQQESASASGRQEMSETERLRRLARELAFRRAREIRLKAD